MKRNKYNCFKLKLKKRKWLKFENWPLKISIRIIKHYTDIDPSVNTRPHISCLYNRTFSENNVSKVRLKIPKSYSEAVVFENFLKD